ncbi:beta-ketoacyl-[acyl-carrier-protein] synthase family protein [Hyalangium gracile]|uniref:beta-ketoacyl-[acyl-carrier-protein] synthase family protein n=1 Tax=Hyalangium gracile TaxID=394092 RepID=UPI001CCA49B5|nr:beta-ketoacyl-[acyl-carrier-protein] synthase family protein [Hyalangium gracile]
MSRAVITGCGIVSALGLGTRAFWNALSEGRAAVGPIRHFDASKLPTRVAGEVPVLETNGTWLREALGGHLSEVAIEAWEQSGALRDRKIGFGWVAALEAWRQAGCGDDGQDTWLSMALGLEQAFLEDFGPLLRKEGGRPSIDWAAESGAPLPRVRFRSRIDLCAEGLTSMLRLGGPVIPHVSACAAGTLAVAHAASLIERGAATRVLCGASDSMVNPLGLGGMSRLGAPSPRAEPDACRPFDRRRDGLVIGEGAAMFVVESEERALARGALPLARILGWGSTQDAYRATAPLPDGAMAKRAMQQALKRAGLSARDIGYVNAHGTGTPLNDPAEARAIREVLGHVPVSSIKGAVGHLMAASGAVELAACLLPFQRDCLPGTAHHRERDPECDIDVIGERPREAHVDTVLSNSFGFGGQNATIILGRWS